LENAATPFRATPNQRVHHLGDGESTVHTADCPNILGSDPERLIQVSWNLQEKTVHSVRVRVICNDKKGLLADISTARWLLG